MRARRTTKRLPTGKAFPILRRRYYTKIPDSKGTTRRSRKLARRKKKPPRGELSAAEKRTNGKLARIRVKVEHALSGVKRCRIVKDVLRNTKEGVSDSAMEAACGLDNPRGQKAQRALKQESVPYSRAR